MPSPRRFPPPWSVEELDACFVLRDHNGQQLGYVYFEDEPGRRSAAKLLAKDETRRTTPPRTFQSSDFTETYYTTAMRRRRLSVAVKLGLHSEG
jgi:hypothetical protein